MYLRLDEGFFTHPKTLALCRILQNREAGMFILRLWRWAVRSSPSGDLSGMDPQDIEDIAQWRGPPGACYAALASVEFIDELAAGGRVLHDWHDWTGADVEELQAEARRKWWYRRHTAKPPKCGGALGRPEACPICVREAAPSAGRPPDIRRTSAVDQARPGQTRPDQTGGREDSSSSGEAAGPPAPATPALLTFPTVRGRGEGGETWPYTQELEDELRGYFPTLDVRAAVLASLAWVKAKPERRKTAKGMRRFVTDWLGRAQNRGEHQLSRGSTSESRRAPAGSGLELYCDWHKQALNDGKPSRRPKSTCPSCKHLTARERVTGDSGPTSIGAIVDEMPGWAK